MNHRIAGLSCTLLALAVMLGAFGAHGLEGVLSERQLSIYHKSSFYHFIHALGLLALAPTFKGELAERRLLKAGCFLLIAGIIVFSGSLYLLALTDQKWLGAVTPIGGLALISGWVLLALVFLRRSPGNKVPER